MPLKRLTFDNTGVTTPNVTASGTPVLNFQHSSLHEAAQLAQRRGYALEHRKLERNISGAFPQSQKAPTIFTSVRPSVRPSACITAAPTGRTSVKFCTEGFYDNLPSESFGENPAKLLATLHDDPNTLHCCRRQKIATIPVPRKTAPGS
jgi:hypothetical protein